MSGLTVWAHQRDLILVTAEDLPAYYQWLNTATSPIPPYDYRHSGNGENHYTMSSPTNNSGTLASADSGM